MVADFVREYHMTTDQVAGIGSDDFLLLLKGLSQNSRFADSWAKQPKHMHDPAERAALMARSRL